MATDKLKDYNFTPERLMTAARDLYTSDTIEIDIPIDEEDQRNCLSQTETGTWVQAWVWVPYTALEEG